MKTVPARERPTTAEWRTVPPEHKCWFGTHRLGECDCALAISPRPSYAEHLARDNRMVEGQWFVIPEYCQGPFFMGWHLYLRQRRDGSPNDDNGWGWIRRGDSLCREIQRHLDSIGIDDQPRLTYSLDTFAEIEQWNAFIGWFVQRFPDGVEVRIDRYPYPQKLSAASAAV